MGISALLVMHKTLVIQDPGKYQPLTRHARIPNVVGSFKCLSRIRHEQARTALFGECFNHLAGESFHVLHNRKIAFQKLLSFRLGNSGRRGFNSRRFAKWF